jgi:hypothetical protein
MLVLPGHPIIILPSSVPRACDAAEAEACATGGWAAAEFISNRDDGRWKVDNCWWLVVESWWSTTTPIVEWSPGHLVTIAA